MAQAKRSSAARTLLLWVVVPLLAFAVIVVVAVTVLRQTDSPLVNANACRATLAGSTYSFTPDRTANAAMITAVSMRRDLPARAATIAIATAIQESSLRNIDYGDRDSLGLFQQRPSQGWGTAAEIMDPIYSTGKFYDVLVTIPNYTTGEVTKVAQAVQRSGFPEAYADHELEARAFASALTGNSGFEINCALGAATPVAPQIVSDRVARDFGAPFFAASVSGSGVRFTPGALAQGYPADLALRALANWSVAHAGEFGISTVRAPGGTWVRGVGWATSGPNVTNNIADAVVVSVQATPVPTAS